MKLYIIHRCDDTGNGILCCRISACSLSHSVQQGGTLNMCFRSLFLSRLPQPLIAGAVLFFSCDATDDT